MFAYSLNELNIWLKLKWKSFWHKLRNSKIQTCDLKVLHRALATVLSYILHILSLNLTFHLYLWNNLRVKEIGCGHRIKGSNLWSPLGTTTLWSWLSYTLRTSSNLDKYSTKNKYWVDMKFNVQSHYLQLWPWPWVCMIELYVLHTLALSWTSYQSELIILQGFEEIWSIRAIQGLIPLPVTVTLTWSLRNESWVQHTV